jgi:hypothetical protein
MGGLNANKEGLRQTNEPLEKQKMDIVKTLIGMSDQIKQFSSNIETKLDKAHKSSSNFDKKFGFERNKVSNIDGILEAHSYMEQRMAEERSKISSSREGARMGKMSQKLDGLSVTSEKTLPPLSGKSGMPPRMPSKTKAPSELSTGRVSAKTFL